MTNSCTGSISGPAEVPQIRPVPLPCLLATAREQLLGNIVVNELPTTPADNPADTPADNRSSVTDPVIYAALLARIEMLEAENNKLKVQLKKSEQRKKAFRLEDIQYDDVLFYFYAGFKSYRIFEAFYEFLGPTTDLLNYWGEKERDHKRK